MFVQLWQGSHRVGLVAGRAECRRPARLKFAEPKFRRISTQHRHILSGFVSVTLLQVRSFCDLSDPLVPFSGCSIR